MATTTYSVATLAGPTLINDATAGAQARPAVVAAGANVGVFYYDGGVAGGRILARTVSAAGAPVGAEQVVGFGASDAPIETATLGDGTIVVTWQDDAANVRFRLYAPDLTPLGPAQLAETASFATGNPDVAALSTGGFVIAYDGLVGAGDSDVFVQRFDRNGAMLGGAVDVAPGAAYDANPSVASTWPAAAVVRLDEFGVGFEHSAAVGGATEAWLATYQPNGAPINAARVIDGSGTINRNIELTGGYGLSIRFPYANYGLLYEDNEGASAGGTDIAYTLSAQGRSRLTQGDSHIDPHFGLSPIAVSFNTVTNNLDASLEGATLALNVTPGVFSQGMPYWLGAGRVLVFETNNSPGVPGSDGSGSAIDAFIVQFSSITIGDDTAEEIFTSAASANVVYAAGGNDVIRAGSASGYDELHGGNGDDTIFAGLGLAFGEAGNDILYASAPALLFGGAGNDTYYLQNDTDVVVELPGEGHDVVVSSAAATQLSANVEDLTANPYRPSFQLLIGNDLDNLILGNVGVVARVLYGLGGDDRIVGAAGGSVIAGGDGADWLYGNYGADYVAGDAGNDIIDNSVYAGGADSLFGGAGDDVLICGSFFALSPGCVGDGGDGNDIVWGTSGADYLVGGEGRDLLVAGPSADYLFGGAGDDTLYGGYGGDYIYSNAGNDFIWCDDLGGGVRGTDYVYVGGGTGVDTIADFDVVAPAGVGAGADVLVISPASGIVDFAGVMAHATQAGIYTVIDLGAGDQVWLYNVQPAQLSAANFLFF